MIVIGETNKQLSEILRFDRKGFLEIVAAKLSSSVRYQSIILTGFTLSCTDPVSRDAPWIAASRSGRVPEQRL